MRIEIDIDRTEFDKHVENLQKHCRVCGERVVTNKAGYTKAQVPRFTKINC